MEVVAGREVASRERRSREHQVAGRGYNVLHRECGHAEFTSDHIRTGLDAERPRCLAHSLHCSIHVDAGEVSMQPYIPFTHGPRWSVYID